MDYKKVLRLHYENKLSGREIAATSRCSETCIGCFNLAENGHFSLALSGRFLPPLTI